MHFSIYLDDATGQRLNALAQQVGETRNALIRQAIQDWMTHQSQWPEAVMQFQGEPDAPAFESYRDRLVDPKDDPLA